MKTTTITDGRRTVTVYVRSPDLTPGIDVPNKTPTVADFLRWFREEGRRCRVGCPLPMAEDYGIASRLLKKHGMERMKVLAGHFWLRYSEPIDEGYVHFMKLFASKIPVIEVEVANATKT